MTAKKILLGKDFKDLPEDKVRIFIKVLEAFFPDFKNMTGSMQISYYEQKITETIDDDFAYIKFTVGRSNDWKKTLIFEED